MWPRGLRVNLYSRCSDDHELMHPREEATTESFDDSVLFRADSSIQMGTGHMMRCLALAQEWRRSGGIHPIFVTAVNASALEARLQSEGIEVVHLPVPLGSDEDAIRTAHLARQLKATWVVVDGYHFGASYQRIIKESGFRLLAIDDDVHARHYYADIVLNQNLYGHQSMYVSREPYTKLLLGTRYVLLRREFLSWLGRKPTTPQVARKVLVTLGGSDPSNVTARVIRALQGVKVKGLEVLVVVGGSNPHYQELQSTVQGSQIPTRLESNVTDMPRLMAWADVAISSAGCTYWELAFVGVPTLVLELAADHHRAAEALHEAKVAINLGPADNLSSSRIAQETTRLLVEARRRNEMARLAQELVDGKGVQRTLLHIKSTALRLRKVRQEDCKLLWEWANDREVRAASFSTACIPWEQHIMWFKSKLRDPHCNLYVATDNAAMPIGQVRYDIKDNEATVSISIDRKFRGRGYGSTLIWISSQEVFSTAHVAVVHAYVRKGNDASIRAFMKAGFHCVGETTVRQNEAVHLALRRDGSTL